MHYSRFLRLYLFTLLLLTLASVLFFQLMERPLKADLETELKLESNNLINLLHKQMSLAFVDIQSDLRFLADQKSLHLLDNAQERQQRIDALKRLWIGFARQRKRYDQIRFIDNNGKEIIRVNYNDGNPDAVAQNLPDRRRRFGCGW